MRTSRLVTCLAVGAAASAVSLSVQGAEKTPAKRPNFLYIPVDDLKPILGCYGNKMIKTPNIDRLAKRGMVFLNAQCQQAVCGPTRASIMTGLYPDTTKVYDLKTRMRDMNPDVLTLPQYLRQNGYETAGVGKTFDPRCVDKDLDKPSWSIPYNYSWNSFLFNKNHPKPMGGYHNPETQKVIMALNKKIRDEGIKDWNAKRKLFAQTPGSRPPVECYDAPDDSYADGAITNKGIQMMEELAKGGKPFFLSIGLYKPHLPFVAPKKYWDLYDRSKIKVDPNPEMPKNGVTMAFQPGWELRSGYSDIPKGRLPEAMQKELIHGYYACISYIDAQVGRMLDKLDELGIADNTIICLWGDHGWHLGDHSMWCKHSNFEQAVHAPLIIAAPQMKTKGEKSDSVVGFVDVFPTLCQLADLPIPKQLQGVSLVPILKDPKAEVKEVQMSLYPRNYDKKKYMGYTLRTKTHRYVAWINQNKLKDKSIANTPDFEELYDYTADPHETMNIAKDPKSKDQMDFFHKKLPECMKIGGME